MTPATQEQIEAACMTRSGDDAWRYLLSQGLRCTRSQCHKALSLLIEDGRRGKLSGGGQGAVGTEIDAFDARMGCERMLRRHLETGRHWISDPARMADALRQAGMVPA